MIKNENGLLKVVWTAGIFRLDRGEWPRSASELKSFTSGKGWGMDLGSFHTLTFRPDARGGLSVEAAFQTEGNWVRRVQVQVEPGPLSDGQCFEATFRTRSRQLPPVKTEPRSYCLLPA